MTSKELDEMFGCDFSDMCGISPYVNGETGDTLRLAGKFYFYFYFLFCYFIFNHSGQFSE